MQLVPRLGPVQLTICGAKVSLTTRLNISLFPEKAGDGPRGKILQRKRHSRLFAQNKFTVVRQASIQHLPGAENDLVIRRQISQTTCSKISSQGVPGIKLQAGRNKIGEKGNRRSQPSRSAMKGPHPERTS